MLQSLIPSTSGNVLDDGSCFRFDNGTSDPERIKDRSQQDQKRYQRPVLEPEGQSEARAGTRDES